MKKLAIYFMLLVAMMPALAQTKKEFAVAEAVEQLRKAMVDADPVMLDKLSSAKLSYGHSGGALDDKRKFVDKIVSGKSDFVTLEFIDQVISIDKNVAIVRHKLDAKTNDNGKPGEVHLNVLLVWQKQRGHWKLLARQAVKIQ
jgi:ketosteroid isomerase-like protein